MLIRCRGKFDLNPSGQDNQEDNDDEIEMMVVHESQNQVRRADRLGRVVKRSSGYFESRVGGYGNGERRDGG